MDLHPDFRDLLAEFARCGVRYALLGGYAVGYHGKPRATKDLDLLLSAQGDNLGRVVDALTAFGPCRAGKCRREQRYSFYMPTLGIGLTYH